MATKHSFFAPPLPERGMQLKWWKAVVAAVLCVASALDAVNVTELLPGSTTLYTEWAESLEDATECSAQSSNDDIVRSLTPHHSIRIFVDYECPLYHRWPEPIEGKALLTLVQPQQTAEWTSIVLIFPRYLLFCALLS